MYLSMRTCSSAALVSSKYAIHSSKWNAKLVASYQNTCHRVVLNLTVYIEHVILCL